ncbi:MAG: hypothetical protein G3M70_05190 [Candidatus Nitronauta litoralis]|uniref:Uncharacterized protein n=1 Tax=Candidatus Nitronauta litoralis TaxID=2705533 RepID=A0A7T0BV07_9BACT|nr:MAG: hypothetical protein G3M70_05190 [Candidatus Nitronauta litoralis]
MRAQVHLELRDIASGKLLENRHAKNTVMQSGAMLIAELFSGRGSRITHMGVGTNDGTPDDISIVELRNEPVGENPALTGGLLAPISTDSFQFEINAVKRLVQVRVRATLPSDAAVGMVREAGLISQQVPEGEGDPTNVLYNRVTFAPIDKKDDHELTLFWEVEFPFGDLH